MRNFEATEDKPRMSDAAVHARTGRVWSEWFGILDDAGARKMSHREIAGYLGRKHRLGPWWGQMVTVCYEQARGMREKHQKPEGYEISVSRTMAVPATKLYDAWADEKSRSRWLSEGDLEVRKATPRKSMRATWKDGKSSLDVAFYPKGDAKTQLVVQHGKLADAKTAARMKTFWTKAIDRLQQGLEG